MYPEDIYQNIQKVAIWIQYQIQYLFVLLQPCLYIIVFSIVWSEHFYIRLLQRVVLIPVIASVSYEILKLAAKKKDFFINKIIIAPGLLIQKITTKEPDEKQIEVAISAVKAVTK